MASVKIVIVCVACNKMLAEKKVSPDTRIKNSITCPNCKTKNGYDIVDGKCYTYKKEK